MTMHALRRSRHLGRYLAAWLLLWFVLMGAGTVAVPAAELGVCSAAAVPDGHADDAHPSNVDHMSHEGHEGLLHCPLCLHAAAPGPAFAALVNALAPPFHGALAEYQHTAVRRADLPPARGPPAIS